MRTVSAREANQQFSKLLEAATSGEEITITRHGVPVARLVPAVDAARAAEAEAHRREVIAWLRGGPISGEAPRWSRDELYDRDEYPLLREPYVFTFKGDPAIVQSVFQAVGFATSGGLDIPDDQSEIHYWIKVAPPTMVFLQA